MNVIRALALALVWGVTIPKLGGKPEVCATTEPHFCPPPKQNDNCPAPAPKQNDHCHCHCHCPAPAPAPKQNDNRSPGDSWELPTNKIPFPARDHDFPSFNVNFKEGKPPGDFRKNSDKNDNNAVVFFKDYNQHKDGNPLKIKESTKVYVRFAFYSEDKEILQSSDEEIVKIHLCYHDMGRGFEIGIEGMHPSGIRRIIIPRVLLHEHLSKKVESHAVCDVELAKKSRWSSQCNDISRMLSSAGSVF